MKHIVQIIIIVALAIVILFVVIILGSTSTLSIKPIGNISVEGRIRFLRATGSNDSVYIALYNTSNMSLATSVLDIDPSCKITRILDKVNGMVTGLVRLKYKNRELIAIGLYNAEDSGTQGTLIIYNASGVATWRLKEVKLQNITITSASETYSLIYAGVDPTGKVHVGKIDTRGTLVRETWNITFDTSIFPKDQRIILAHDYMTKTIAVGIGGTITILDEDNGHIILGPWNSRGVVEKILEIPGKYIVLVREGTFRRILVFYKDDKGIWGSTQLYANYNIVDLGAVYGGKPYIIVGEGVALKTVMERKDNYTGRIVILDEEGSPVSEVALGDTVIGVRGGFQLSRDSVYILVDYVIVNDSITTFYSGLISVMKSDIIWKHAALVPVRSILMGVHLYLAELGENISRIQCYMVAGFTK